MANPIRFKDFADLSDVKESAKVFDDLERDVIAAFKNMASIGKKQFAEVNKSIKELKTTAQSLQKEGFNNKNANLKQIIKEYENLAAAQKEAKDTLKGLSQTEDFAKKSIQGLKKEAKSLQNEYNRLVTVENKNSESSQRLATEIRKVKSEAYDLAQETRRVSNEFTAATGSYNALTLENKKLNEELRNIPVTVTGGVTSFGKFERRARALQEQIRKNTETQKQYDREIGRNFRNVGNYAESIIEAKSALDRQKSSLLTQIRALERQSAANKRNTDIQNKVQAELRQTRGELEKVNAELRQYGDSSRRAGDISKGIAGGFSSMALELGGAYLGLAGLQQAFRFTINTNREISDSLADVRKTTGLTNEEVKTLLDTITQFNTRTSIQGLLEIAKIGGQLGVAGRDIAGFTKAVDVANVALGDEFAGGAEEISSAIGKINSVFQVSERIGVEQGIINTGSAINALGAAGLATAPYLADFTKRLGGISANVGESVQDVLGLAAAAEELGQSSEVASSVITQVFQKMATETGKFANVAGLNIEEFESIINKDINAALLLLLEGLQKSTKNTTEFGRAVKSLGLDGIRATGVLSGLSNNVDLVREKQRLANIEFEKGTSLINEFNIKNNTFAASLDKLNKATTALTLSLNGEGGLSSALRFVTDGLTEFIEGIASANRSFEQIQKTVNAGLISEQTKDNIIEYDNLVQNLISKGFELEDAHNRAKEALFGSLNGIKSEIDSINNKIEDNKKLLEGGVEVIPELDRLLANGETLREIQERLTKENEKLNNSLVTQKALYQALKSILERDTAEKNENGEATRELTKEQKELIDSFNKAANATLSHTFSNYEYAKSIFNAKERLKEFVDQLQKLSGFGLSTDLSEDAKILKQAIEETFGDDFFGGAEKSAKEFFDKIDKRIIDHAENYKKAQKEKTEALLNEQRRRDDIVNAGFYFAQGLLHSISESTYARYHRETQALEAQKAYELSLVADNENAKSQIEQRFARQQLQLKRKQARTDKALALFNIGVNTAQGIVAALASVPPNVPLSIAIGVIGAIQAGLVASKPLPAFYKGTKNAPEGPALVGEKGWEFVERDGKFMQTNDGPQIMPLKKGDKVYPHDESIRMLRDAEKAIQMQMPLQAIEVHGQAVKNVQKNHSEDIVKSIAKNGEKEASKIVRAINSKPVVSLAREGDKLYDVFEYKNHKKTVLNKYRN